MACFSTRLIIPALCGLLLGGCGQIANESLPPQLGGTGSITLYGKDTQDDTCPLRSSVEYVRYPMGLGSPAGEKFVVSVFNETPRAYTSGILLIRTHRTTGALFRKEIESGVTLQPKEDGPPYGVRLRGPGDIYKYNIYNYKYESGHELPTENWRDYRWTVELPDCHVITEATKKELDSSSLKSGGKR